MVHSKKGEFKSLPRKSLLCYDLANLVTFSRIDPFDLHDVLQPRAKHPHGVPFYCPLVGK